MFTSAVRWVGLVQLDLFTLVPFGCLYSSNFHTLLLVRTLVPIGVLLLLASIACFLLKTNNTSTQKGASRVWLANVLMSVFLLLVTGLAPKPAPTSATIFRPAQACILTCWSPRHLIYVPPYVLAYHQVFLLYPSTSNLIFSAFP